MDYQITSGAEMKAQKVLIYGVEGIGKTTLAAKFPNPLFIDIEDGTKHMDVKRLPRPTSWNMLLDEILWIKNQPDAPCDTIVIDSLDWAQQLACDHLLGQEGKSSIEDWGYGQGYVRLYQEFGKVLNLLSDCAEAGFNVVALAHSMISRFEQPDEIGSYDRWTLKLQSGNRSNIQAQTKEWADAVLFCNFKTIVTVTDDKTKKAKAQGGTIRKMYANHRASWDAKNRYGLADELPLDFDPLAPFIPALKTWQKTQRETVSETPTTTAEAPQKPAQEPSQTDGLAALRLQITGFGLTEEQVMKAIISKGYLPQGSEFSLLEKRKDLVAWIPTVLDQIRDSVTTNQN